MYSCVGATAAFELLLSGLQRSGVRSLLLICYNTLDRVVDGVGKVGDESC